MHELKRKIEEGEVKEGGWKGKQEVGKEAKGERKEG